MFRFQQHLLALCTELLERTLEGCCELPSLSNSCWRNIDILCTYAESLPEADFVVGFQRYEGLPATLRSALGGAALSAEPTEPVLPPHRVQVGCIALQLPLYTTSALQITIAPSNQRQSRVHKGSVTPTGCRWDALSCILSCMSPAPQITIACTQIEIGEGAMPV